ncbi:MAG: hypothetical protein M3R24_17550 [Chloroflexota bacterium]|nr:hypothetical protein [Chloroflexota bacterium]
MKPSKQMQAIVTAIATKHNLDLQCIGAHLRLTMPNFDRLVIEVIGRNQVSVAHYFEQHGDLVADPEIVFFTGADGWYPIEITQVFGSYQKVAWLTADQTAIDRFLPLAQREVATFATLWARNIRAQGWLEHGQVAAAAVPND